MSREMMSRGRDDEQGRNDEQGEKDDEQWDG